MSIKIQVEHSWRPLQTPGDSSYSNIHTHEHFQVLINIEHPRKGREAYYGPGHRGFLYALHTTGIYISTDYSHGDRGFHITENPEFPIGIGICNPFFWFIFFA